jgi:5'-3' exonuclease
MGIKNLNRFLRDNCTKRAIHKVNLKYFANKIVVIDTSIYLYKFMGEGALMENMYLFISILKSYNITPIFIFDGKPPPEKKELLNRRRIEKKDAEQKYLNIESTINNANDEDKKEMLLEMDSLRRQFIRINQEDIRKVKTLMDAYGVQYVESPAEADVVCAYLVKSGKAHACMSDDMDMFLYGCPLVIRHISLKNHTAILYDTSEILTELDMTPRHFCEIMVLSGTDYNIDTNVSLYETLKWFRQYNNYREFQKQKNEKILEFYVWLVKNTKYISDFNKLLRVYSLFQIDNNNNLKQLDNLERIERNQDLNKLKEIMTREGFVFA